MRLLSPWLLVVLVISLPAIPSGLARAQSESDGDVAATPSQVPRFDIWEFQVEGNSLLERMQVERTVYSHLGPKKTIEDVEAARAGLEALYRSKGYATVLVNIPEQDVEEGIVFLDVIEGPQPSSQNLTKVGVK